MVSLKLCAKIAESYFIDFFVIMMLATLAFGFLGGLIRGVVGFIKHQYAYKNVPFKWGYFLSMMAVSGLVGLIVVSAIRDIGFSLNHSFTYGLAIIVGYAGGDFLENIYKIIVKKSDLFLEKEE